MYARSGCNVAYYYRNRTFFETKFKRKGLQKMANNCRLVQVEWLLNRKRHAQDHTNFDRLCEPNTSIAPARAKTQKNVEMKKTQINVVVDLNSDCYTALDTRSH
jgi:hypothetical protein